MPDCQATCQQCLERLGAYLDGELEPLPRLEVDGHLAQCLLCRRLVASCRQTIQVYRRQPLSALPAAVHEKVMARLAQEKIGH